MKQTKENLLKVKNNKAITLIALVITIIVLLILAGVTISTLTGDNGLLGKTSEAQFITEIQQYNEELKLAIAEDYTNSMGNRENKFNVRRSSHNDEKSFTDAMKTKIPSFKEKYANKLEIKEDELQYIGEDEQERSWLAQAIKLAGMLRISYVYENGNEAAPTYQKVITDGSCVVESPIIKGYEPDHYKVEGKSNQDINMIVTYYSESQGLTYEELSDGTYTVSGIETFIGETLVIPREYNGKAVTQIKSQAFYQNKALKNVIISDTVKIIGSSAFSGCGNITYVNLNAEKINGQWAFECANLRKVDIGSNVSSIGSRTFHNCKNLTDVTIYTEKSDINAEMFNGCTSLKELKVNDDNNKYKVINGVLYSKDEKKIYMYPNGKEGETYIIPSTVEEIGSSAFYGNSNLTHMDIPSTVKIIRQAAFEFSGNINYINLNAEKVVGTWAFQCANLRRVDIGSNVSSIDSRTFHQCKNLTDVTIYTEKSDINAEIFNGCTSLKELKVNDDNNKYKVINGVLYSKDEKKIYMYPNGKEGETYIIPSTVEEIGSSAFYNNSNLTYMDIPSTVKTVGTSAFDSCGGITYINLNAEKVTGQWAFGCINLKKVDIGTNVNFMEFKIFNGCKKVEEVNYKGTKAQWDLINKKSGWNNNSNITQVKCSDETVNV